MQEFNEVDPFMAAFREQADTGNKFIAVMVGSDNPETGKSWCPDCVVAQPHIQRIFEAANGSRVFIKGNVTREEWRGNAGHPFRQAPFNAGGVPCVGLFQGSTQLYKVDDLGEF